MKRILTILFVVVIAAVAAYIIFWEFEVAKPKIRESVRKPEPVASETEEPDPLKNREEIYRLAAEKDKSAVAQLLTQLKDDSPMVRLAAARAIVKRSVKDEVYNQKHQIRREKYFLPFAFLLLPL
jgi:HEAT repeat protein